MKKTIFFFASLLCLAPGCGEKKDEAPAEAPGAPSQAGNASTEENWPAKAVKRVEDILGKGAPAFDEKTLLAYMQVHRRRMALVNELSNNQVAAGSFEGAFGKVLKEAGFRDGKEFEKIQECILSTRMVLMGLISLDMQLQAAEGVPSVSQAVEKRVEQFRKGILENEYRPTIDELRLVSKHFEEME